MRGRGLALGALAAGVFVSGLDGTVVVSILPRIAFSLRVPITQLDRAAWLVTAYLLGYTVALPLVGRLADVYGYRRAFAGCAALFAGGSLWAALTPGLWTLVAARGIQAVGGGGMVPVALAATARLASGRSRALALGVVTAAAEAGAVLGPLYGSVLVRELSWRWAFWLNLPLSALLLALVGAALGLLRPVGAGRVDWAGAGLAAAALLALALGLSGGGTGIPRGARLGLLGAAALGAAAFVAAQARARTPLVPLALLRRRALASATAANALVGAALVVALVEVPLFATVVLRRDATAAGLTLLRLTALIPVGALAGGWLAARAPAALPAAAGMTASAAGFVMLSRLGRAAGEPGLTLELGLTGLGFGLVLAPYAGSALSAARGGSEAVGSALLTLARSVGMMAALASLTTWGLAAFDRRVSGLSLPLRAAHETSRSYHARLAVYEHRVIDAALWVFDRLFLVAAGLCLAAAVTGLWLRSDAGRRALG